MKKVILSITALCFIVLSCSKESSELGNSNPTSNPSLQFISDIFSQGNIGYYNEETTFVSISVDEFEEYLKKLYDEQEITHFDNHEIKSSANSEHFYIFSTIEGKSVATTVSFEPDLEHYAISGGKKTCECTSTDCGSGSCNASINNYGDCECTYCFETCTKNSSITIEVGM